MAALTNPSDLVAKVPMDWQQDADILSLIASIATFFPTIRITRQAFIPVEQLHIRKKGIAQMAKVIRQIDYSCQTRIS